MEGQGGGEPQTHHVVRQQVEHAVHELARHAPQGAQHEHPRPHKPLVPSLHRVQLLLSFVDALRHWIAPCALAFPTALTLATALVLGSAPALASASFHGLQQTVQRAATTCGRS